MQVQTSLSTTLRSLLFSKFFLILLTLAWSVPSLHAQPPAKTKSATEEKKIPEPENIKIEVKDATSKLELACTYYASNMGKEAIPVLLLHGFEGSRADYTGLALALQQQGHAVLVPDLRGHGDSNSVLFADGKRVEILAKKMTSKDFLAMIGDLDHIKSWLLDKNNAGELNLESLVLVGADWTTIVGMNWALRDWTAQELINYKNCKDVKALVLLSPEQTFKTMNMKLALNHPVVGHKLSTMVVVGSKSSGPMDEAKRLDSTLKRQHGETNTDKKPKDREVVFVPVDTNLQGTKLLDRNLNVATSILKFIEFRVREKADEFSYSQRIKP
jgi:pimeloyl-ACP methyl ester carboxylesterase